MRRKPLAAVACAALAVTAFTACGDDDDDDAPDRRRLGAGEVTKGGELTTTVETT